MAQESQSKQENKKKNTKQKEKKTIKEIIKNSERIDGLFTLFRDKDSGELRLLLKPEQLNTNYLYFTYVENGVHAAGFSLTRGAYNVSQAKSIRLSRHFNKIEWAEQNTHFYSKPEKAISRAEGANISPALIFSQTIEAENKKTGAMLIQVNSLFLSESLFAVRPLPNPDSKPHESFSLGKLSSAKSKIARIRNYPENTDLRVEYVYENDTPYQNGGPAVTDPRYISIVVQHTLLKVPDNPMTPRFDDPRVGYFGHQITDLSSSELTPYRDVISRFRLEKKDPTARLSEPVKPITFWLENTTPLELRPIIAEAALRWNDAFEKAGFKNALVIKTQPDDASWDAGDIRYNVIRWVSSPSRFYSGYGPSFHDPRTGEVLGADIMLEYASLSRSARLAKLIDNNTLTDNVHSHRPEGCQASEHAAQQYLFGLNALQAFGASDQQQQRLLKEFVYFLTLHEIGHTLGLNHNFRSNYLHSFEDIFKPEITYPRGLQGSIMDYPAVPLQPNNALQNQFYSTRPGPYDEWAIEFGYHPPLDDADAEQRRVDALLSRSVEPALAFANDADDMRSPGKGIDPRSMVYAQSSDPIRFAQYQISQLRSVQAKLRQKMEGEKDLHHALLQNHHLSLALLRRNLDVISRFIGGVYVERTSPGETAAASRPFRAVDVD
ncbi:MAG: zinc-dependent metalloprotease, partial [Cellvibrionaceae bacterium]|nr:zinc-dependent metalloprotease [Cellvibrionaceae bacterium]